MLQVGFYRPLHKLSYLVLQFIAISLKHRYPREVKNSIPETYQY
jgi:hypothetical protein